MTARASIEDRAAERMAPPRPEPLPEGLPAVPALDLDLLPAALRPWVTDIAERIQCPADYPAVGAMVALSAVVGRQVGIRPRVRDDWTVCPNLWGAIVGRPGLLKTPALSEVMRPLHRLEAKAREDHNAASRDHQVVERLAAAEKKATDAAITKATKRGDRDEARQLAIAAAEGMDAEAPQRRRYCTSDTTVEALGELLAANPRGVMVYRDELVGWLKDLEREGREGSRSFYLEAWNGTGRYTYDRIGRGTIDIEAACVSILGGIQPGPLSAYLRDALDGGAGDDGLLQRLQVVAWPDPPRTWRDVDRWPDTVARRQAWEVYERLDRIDPPALGAGQESDGIPYLRLSPAAQEIMSDWRRELEGRLRQGTEHPAFEAACAKQRSLLPSLALLCHLADCPQGGPVGEASMLRALAWVKYLEEHSRRLYAPALDPSLHAARELDRHLRAGDLPEQFRARDIYRRCWRLLDRRGTEDALDYLHDLGRLLPEEIDTGGRPTIVWSVHPELRRA